MLLTLVLNKNMKNLLLIFTIFFTGCALSSSKIPISDIEAEKLIIGSWNFEKLLSSRYDVNFIPVCVFSEDRKVDCTYTGESCGGFCCEIFEEERGWNQWAVTDGYLILRNASDGKGQDFKVRIISLTKNQMDLEMNKSVARYNKINYSSILIK